VIAVTKMLVRLAAFVVLVMSGIYVLVYLYRWEWNRAIVSALFFVAAEVGLATMVVLGRLRAIEERLDRAPAASPAVREALRTSNATPSRAFDWLRDASTRTNVFLPVLLGSGVVLSALAYLVERFAASVAGHTVDRRVARDLRPLALPAGGLLAPAGTDVGTNVRRADTSRRAPALIATSLVAITVALGLGVNLLRDATQSRPEPLEPDATTVVQLRIDQRRSTRPLGDVVDALWATCSTRISQRVELTRVAVLTADTVRLEASPALGDRAQRRLVGCFMDGTLDFVQVHVRSAARVPAGS
jgi:hypothetical protein